MVLFFFFYLPALGLVSYLEALVSVATCWSQHHFRLALERRQAGVRKVILNRTSVNIGVWWVKHRTLVLAQVIISG